MRYITRYARFIKKYYLYLPPRGCGKSCTKKQTLVPAGTEQPIRVDDKSKEGGIQIAQCCNWVKCHRSNVSESQV